MAPTGFGSAAPVFELDLEPGDMQGNFNVPRLVLTNASTGGETITGFSLGIGDPDYFFDFVAHPNSSPAGLDAHRQSEVETGASLVSGDRENDRSGVALLAWSFVDFQPGESLVFQVDVDPLAASGGGSQTADARTVLFANGSAPNAALGVSFSDGTTASGALPDADPSATSFRTTGGGASPVPQPASALLVAGGLAGLGAARRRRR